MSDLEISVMPTEAPDIMQDFISLMKSLINTLHDFRRIGNFLVIGGAEVILLKPSTLMNLSGKSVAAVSTFYKISPSEILVAHDELDLLPGTVRLKISGGSAGHNGLKSIVSCLGSSDFARLRIGIGHPRDRQLQIPVADYVLSRPPKEDLELISSAIEKALACIDEIVDGDFSRAMSALNEKTDSRK